MDVFQGLFSFYLFFSVMVKSEIIVWNCQGAGYPNFHRIMKEYIREFNPSVVVLQETRTSSISSHVAERVIKNIGWKFSHRVKACGFSGGIWVLWKEAVCVNIEENHFQFVNVKVKFPLVDEWVQFTGVYGSPNRILRRELWSMLGRIAHGVNGLWLVSGDFNAMLNDDEKKGGR